MVVKVAVLAFMFANTEQGGVMGFFLPLMPRWQILLNPKVFKRSSLALRQPFAQVQFSRKANTGCGIVKMIC